MFCSCCQLSFQPNSSSNAVFVAEKNYSPCSLGRWHDFLQRCFGGRRRDMNLGWGPCRLGMASCLLIREVSILDAVMAADLIAVVTPPRGANGILAACRHWTTPSQCRGLRSCMRAPRCPLIQDGPEDAIDFLGQQVSADHHAAPRRCNKCGLGCGAADETERSRQWKSGRSFHRV